MIKITVKRDALHKALKRSKNVIEKKPLVPVLENVLFNVEGNSMKVIASDSDITMVSTIQLEETFEPTTFVLPFDFLSDTVDILEVESIILEVKKTSAVIVSFTDRFEIAKLAKADDFPKLPDLPIGQNIGVNEDILSAIIKASSTMADASSSRLWTEYVCLDIKSSTLTVVSTTMKMLFRKVFAIEGPADPVQLLIRAKVLKLLKTIAPTSVQWSDNHVAFQSEEAVMFAKRPDTQYAKYESVIPDFGSNLIVNRAELILGLKKASLAASIDAGATINLKASDKGFTIEAADDSGRRKTKADIPATYTGECESINIQPDFFLTLIEQAPDGDIDLSVVAPNKAILLKTKADDTYTGLLMPIAKVSKK